MSDEQKIKEIVEKRAQSFYEYPRSAYGGDILQKIKIIDYSYTGVSLTPDGKDVTGKKGSTGRVVHELLIEEPYCNPRQIAHGGFVSWLIDMCSSAAVTIISSPDKWVKSGLSTNISTYYTRGAPLGERVRIISETALVGASTAVIKVELRSPDNAILYAFGVHMKQDVKFTPVPKTAAKL